MQIISDHLPKKSTAIGGDATGSAVRQLDVHAAMDTLYHNLNRLEELTDRLAGRLQIVTRSELESKNACESAQKSPRECELSAQIFVQVDRVGRIADVIEKQIDRLEI